MNDPLAAGYPYELAGFVYYAFFIAMGRPRFAGRYSRRSRLLVAAAAIVMVGSVPFRYAANAGGVTLMLGLAVAALISAFLDGVRRR